MPAEQTKPDFQVPSGACDTHTHVFGKPAAFVAGRGFTPSTASAEELIARHRALGLERVVLVTSNVYGTDNSDTLAGMKAYGPGARGVAVTGDGTSDDELDAMDRTGFRGIRISVANALHADPDALRRRLVTTLERAARRNWHLQLYLTPAIIPAIQDLLLASPAPVVFDHFGSVDSGLGLDQSGFPELLALVRSGKAYVKISAPYRSSTAAPDYADMIPFAQSLIAANPDRILWATDWPHPNAAPGARNTDVSPHIQVDDGRLMNLLPIWAPAAELRRRILVENPARLYGF